MSLFVHCPYMAPRPPKSGRIELRTDRRSEKRIRMAASIKRQTVSAFMLEAAAQRADEVLAEARELTLPGEYFDAVWESLSRPPRPNRKLAAVARKPAQFSQRW